MAFIDDEGNRLGGPTSSLITPTVVAPTPQPVNTVINAGAGTGPSSPYKANPAPSTNDFIGQITQSPEYKQSMENVDLWAQQQKDQAAFDAEWTKKFHEMNAAQIANSYTPSFVGSYGAGEAQQAQLDALQKEKAAHDLKNMQEYTREALGSRGLASSGQNAVDQGELSFSYDSLIKQIDLQAQARAAQLAETRANAAGSAAQSNANQQRSISNQLADQNLRYQYELAKQGQYDKTLAAEIAQRKGQALLQVADQLRPYYFGSDGVYRDASGNVVTVEQAQQSTGLYAAPGTTPALFAPTQSIGTSNASPYGW